MSHPNSVETRDREDVFVTRVQSMLKLVKEPDIDKIRTRFDIKERSVSAFSIAFIKLQARPRRCGRLEAAINQAICDAKSATGQSRGHRRQSICGSF